MVASHAELLAERYQGKLDAKGDKYRLRGRWR
jgi:hypothetical protein